MNGLNQIIHMLHFIKNPKGKPSRYVGMCGKFLVEILDNDPILIRALKSKSASKIYKPSRSCRFTGNNQRMVLAAKTEDGLFTLRKTKAPKGYEGIELGILTVSKDSFGPMLKDLALLANQKWDKLPLFLRLGLHADIANLEMSLFNQGWIKDEYNSIMERKAEEKKIP